MVRTFLIKNAPIERINFWLNRNAVQLKYGDNYRDFNFKKCLAVSTEEITFLNLEILLSDHYKFF